MIKKLLQFFKLLFLHPRAAMLKLRSKIIHRLFHNYRTEVTDYVRSHTEVQNNKIAIMTNTGRYTCNPKYIYEELKRQGKNYDIVWIRTRDERRSNYPEDARVVTFGTITALKEIFSAKVWLDNGIAFSNHFEKKPEQIHIQTMHGSLGIKRMDNAVDSRMAAGKRGQTVVRRESENTNYVITNSQFEEDVFRSIFWKNTPMLRLGHARTDILFQTSGTLVDEVRDELFIRYGIPADKKIAMYGPTHRRGLTAEDINIDYPALIQALNKRFGGEFVVLLRLHDRIRNIIAKDYITDEVFDVTNYPDMQRLMMVCDVGITDYSSWIYDYVVTGRPGFLFATDLERYNNNTGLYYPLEATPFPVCMSNEQLIEKVESFDSKLFEENRIAFLDEKQAVDDGKSAQRIAEWLETIVPVS